MLNRSIRKTPSSPPVHPLFKINLLGLIFTCCFFTSAAQFKGLDSFISESGLKPTQVMLVGTYHFAYQNLDQHQIGKKNRRNILSAQSQHELQELLDVLRQYKPTRIYLESKDPHWLDSCYEVFADSTLRSQPNERFQIGFRLARELHLKKVYAMDAYELINEWYKNDSVSLIKTLGSDSVVDPVRAKWISSTYTKFYNYLDSICAYAPLLDAFIFMNTPRNLQLNYGAYLSGNFNTVGHYGPDYLATWFIDRNLRIFHNILRTNPSGNDRILVLIGAGHIPFLKQFFESSPEFEIVDFYHAALKMRKH